MAIQRSFGAKLFLLASSQKRRHAEKRMKLARFMTRSQHTMMRVRVADVNGEQTMEASKRLARYVCGGSD